MGEVEAKYVISPHGWVTLVSFTVAEGGSSAGASSGAGDDGVG